MKIRCTAAVSGRIGISRNAEKKKRRFNFIITPLLKKCDCILFAARREFATKKRAFPGEKAKKYNEKTSFARSETEIPSVFTFPVCYYVQKYLVFGGRLQRLTAKTGK